MMTPVSALEARKEKQIRGWFYGSLAVAVLVVFLSAIEVLATYNPLRSASLYSWMTSNRSLVAIVFDAMFWQLLSVAILIATIIMRYWNEQVGWKIYVRNLVGLGLLMAAVFILGLWVEKVALKPALHYLRFDLHLPEGIISEFGYRRFASIRIASSQTGYTSAPSGFAIRQALLFLGFVVYGWSCRRTSRVLPIVGLVLVSALSVLTLASRVLIGAHSIRDMSLGLTIGIVAFWLGYSLVQIARKRREYFEELLIPAGTSSFAMLFYCHDPYRWMLIGGVVLAGSLLMYCIFIVRKGLHQKGV